jgi:hypothetical protein
MLIQLGKALLLSSLALLPTTSAQDCSALAVDHQGTVADGGTLTMDVTGSLSDAIVFMAVSRDLASSCVPLGMDEICLDVDLTQAIVVPLGLSDTSGDLSLVVELPPGPSGVIDGQTLHFQTVALAIDFSTMIPVFAVCVSNAVSVQID